MTKKASTNGAPRFITFDDLRAARFRTAEVVVGGGAPMRIAYMAMSGNKAVAYMDREGSDEMSDGDKYRAACADLAEALVNEDGSAFATQEQLMELDPETITALIKTVAGVKDKEGDEGNVSGEAGGSASPTA